MSKSEKAIANLKSIGYTDDKIAELIEVLAPEVEQQLFLDLAGSCTEAEVDAFAEQLKSSKSNKDYDKILEDMAKKAYGDNWKDKLDEIMAVMLDEMGAVTLKTRDLYQKYMQKDPEAVKTVEKLQKDPAVKQLAQDMKAEGLAAQ